MNVRRESWGKIVNRGGKAYLGLKSKWYSSGLSFIWLSEKKWKSMFIIYFFVAQ